MTLYRDMTTTELVERALDWNDRSPFVRRLMFALAKRLEDEHQRANDLDLELAIAHTAPPPADYLKVVKPHISICSSSGYGWPSGREVWRCTGPLGSTQYGISPSVAYAAWRKAMVQGQATPRYIRRMT